ncbi:hypothetical protein D3C72_1285550 [compost metagenome]
MGGVNQQHVHTGFHQGGDALFVACTGTDGGTDPQTAALVFTGVRLALGFLEVFDGDHALQFEVGVHHQHLLDTVLLHQGNHLFARGPFTHGDQTILLGHDLFNGLGEIDHEAHITAGDDADQLVAVSHHGVTGETVLVAQLLDLGDGHVRAYGDGVGDHAALVLLDLAHFGSLLLDGHVLVNEADTAFLGQCDSQTGFGHCVHGSGNHRDIQGDSRRELGTQVGGIRKNSGVCWNQQYIVEGQRFFGNPEHGNISPLRSGGVKYCRQILLMHWSLVKKFFEFFMV